MEGLWFGGSVEQGRGDGCLGQPVGVEQSGPGCGPQRVLAVRGVRRLTAGDHQPDTPQPLVVRLGEREQLVPVRGSQVDDGDPLVLEVAEQVGRSDRAGRREHQGGPGGQRDEDLLNRGVKGEGGELDHPVGASDLVGAGYLTDDAGQAGVADRDRLGPAGGSRGVDRVAHGVRVQADLGRRDRLARQVGDQAADHEQSGPGSGEVPGEFRGRVPPGLRSGRPGQDGHRARFFAYPGQPARRERRVERQVAAARFHDREQAADRVDAALEVHADQGLRASAQLPEVVREPVRRLVELAIGQRRSPGDDGGRAGSAGRLLGDQVMGKPDSAGVRNRVRVLSVPCRFARCRSGRC